MNQVSRSRSISRTRAPARVDSVVGEGHATLEPQNLPGISMRDGQIGHMLKTILGFANSGSREKNCEIATPAGESTSPLICFLFWEFLATRPAPPDNSRRISDA